MPEPAHDEPPQPDSRWRLKELAWVVAAWAAVIAARSLLESHLWGMLVLASMLVLAQLMRMTVTRDERLRAMDRPTQLRHAVLTSAMLLAVVYTSLVVGRAALPPDLARLLDWFGPSLAELGG